jgi:hypothetical protein
MAYTFLGEIPKIATRKREENFRRPVSGWERKSFHGQPDTYTDPIYEGFSTGFQRTTHDVVVPQFESRSRNGAVFMNPYSSVFRERKDSLPPYWRWDTTNTNPAVGSQTMGEGLTSRGQLRDPENAPPGTWYYVDTIDVASLQRLAGTKAWASVQEPEFDTPVFIGEAATTYRMLVNPWDNLWRWLQDSVRSNRELARRKGWSGQRYRYEQGRAAAQLLASEWLKLRYGVWPLLRDIESSLGILRSEPAFGKRHTARAQVESNDFLWEAVSPITDTFYSGERYLAKKRKVTVRAGILYTYNVHTYSRLSLNGLSSLPRVGWELVPFSFVFDWLFNVGDVLAALESKAYCTVLGQWTTTHDVETWISEVRNSLPKAVSGVTLQGSLNHRAELVKTTKSREPRTQVGFAKQAQILDMSKNAWRNRLLDVAAFASGFLSKGTISPLR